MVKCREDGIIPHVITDDGKDGYELEISYQEADADASATNTEELKKALHAGMIPEAYKDVISGMEVKEIRRKVSDEHGKNKDADSIYGTPEEMMERAKEGYFVRDPERNLVYCPSGEILLKASQGKNSREDVFIRASVWNHKKDYGIWLLSTQRTTESNRRICAYVHGIQHKTSEKSIWI